MASQATTVLVETKDWQDKMIEVIRRHGLEMLPWNGEALALQARILSLRAWRPEENWPDVSDTTLLACLDTWLIPYLEKTDLDSLDMKEVLLGFLDPVQRRRIDRQAPTRIRIPGGYRRLRYSPGRPPVLAVLVQEMYGISSTPTVCNGEVPVTLHLLTPAQTPIQITHDLSSFWNTVYLRQRKELLVRYPRHYWPTEPWKATPRLRSHRKKMAH